MPKSIGTVFPAPRMNWSSGAGHCQTVTTDLLPPYSEKRKPEWQPKGALSIVSFWKQTARIWDGSLVT